MTKGQGPWLGQTLFGRARKSVSKRQRHLPVVFHKWSVDVPPTGIGRWPLLGKIALKNVKFVEKGPFQPALAVEKYVITAMRKP